MSALEPGDAHATDLTPEERADLIPTWISTRADLNRAEAMNIAAGLRWAQRSRGFDVLEPRDLMRLHGRMFGEVWRWAGRTRESEKNIGIADWWRIPEHLANIAADTAAQVAAAARPPDEIAVDFHHRLVALHVFPNGNGRHARLAADLLVERLGGEPFSWGRGDLQAAGGQARDVYIAALQSADAHDPRPLYAFARS